MSEYNFRTVDIKGKDYVMVNERIKYFRENPKYESWSIEIGIEKLDLGTPEDQVVTVAIIKNKDGKVMSMARSWEVRNSSFINKTSFVENSETSAVGRALGFLGIGVDTSIASFEEVVVAVAAQDSSKNVPVELKPAPKPAPLPAPKPATLPAPKQVVHITPTKSVVSNNKAEDNDQFDEMLSNITPSNLEEAGDHVISFGKFKGTPVNRVNPKDLKDWYEWILTTDFDKKKYPKDMSAVEAILDARRFRK